MNVSALQAQAFMDRVEALAADVGRLRRRLAGDEYGSYLVDRLALHVEVLDAFLWATAGEIYQANICVCGDEDESVAAALEDVDDRARRFRALLGEKAA